MDDKTYALRITLELYDSLDAKTRRYVAPAEHFQRVFTACDDASARKIQAHCWHACGLAVINEIQKDTEG